MFLSLLPFSGKWFSSGDGNQPNRQVIIRKAARHTYTTDIVVVLPCLHHHVVVCENVLHYLKSEVGVEMA